MIKASAISALLLFGLSSTFFGQDQNAGLRTHYGFIIPHRAGIENLIKGHVKSFDLSYEKRTSGAKSWHHRWGRPWVGVNLFGADLANPSQLGWSAALFPYVRYKIVGGDRLYLSFKIGAGLGYVSKRFDVESNYKNVMVGSHININANLGSDVRWRITPRLEAHAGLNFMHYSNGAFKVPNLGINIPSVTAGLQYSFGETDREALDVVDSSAGVSRHEFIVTGLFGLKENYPTGGEKYPTYCLSLYYNRGFQYGAKLSIIADFFYNTSLRPAMESRNLGTSFFDISQQGVMVAYQNMVGHLGIFVGQGFYYRTKFKGDTHFYHRIGVTYRVHQRITAHWLLKTHFFKADTFEFGIGYRIAWKDF